MTGGGSDALEPWQDTWVDEVNVVCAPSDGSANENQSTLVIVLAVMGASILILTISLIISICCFISVKKEYEKTSKDVDGVTNELTMLKMQQSSAEYEVPGADYRGR